LEIFDEGFDGGGLVAGGLVGGLDEEGFFEHGGDGSERRWVQRKAASWANEREIIGRLKKKA
jgi:hypothetical protein